MDPVLGDDNKIYVPLECIPLYRDVFLPIADIITPNDFEVELLSGIKIQNFNDAKTALDKLHNLGSKTIVITSTLLTKSFGLDGTVDDNDHHDDADSEELVLFGSHIPIGSTNPLQFYVRFPKISGSFTGTGDLFAALLTGRIGVVINYESFKNAVLLALSSMHKVLKRTLISYQQKRAAGLAEQPSRELALIESKLDIESNDIIFQSIEIL